MVGLEGTKIELQGVLWNGNREEIYFEVRKRLLDEIEDHKTSEVQDWKETYRKIIKYNNYKCQ